jgi:hypothetical protein
VRLARLPFGSCGWGASAVIRSLFASGLTLALLLAAALHAPAADPEKIQRAIDRGVAHLRATQGKDGKWRLPAIGATALAGLTLLECNVPADDPAVQKAARVVRAEAPGQSGTYSLALVILFLDRLGDPRDRTLIQALGIRLLAGQNRQGGWPYLCPVVDESVIRRVQRLCDQRHELVARAGQPKAAGDGRARARLSAEIEQDLAPVIGRQFSPSDDNSNTQFAILGLWVARRHGVPVEAALERVRLRFRGSQNADGGWGYSRFYGDGPASEYSMTCAGLLGLACAYGSAAEAVLGTERGAAARDGKDRSGLDPAKDPAIRKALMVLGGVVGRSVDSVGPSAPPIYGYQMGGGIQVSEGLRPEYAFYFLWSLERVAVAYGLDTIGKRDWYAWGARALLATQQRDGSWRGACRLGEADTCFALLFLRRANLTKDLTAGLTGKIRDPGPSLLRGGGFGGEKIAHGDGPAKPQADDPATRPETRPKPVDPSPPLPVTPAPKEPAPPRATEAAPARPELAVDPEAARLSRRLVRAPAALQQTMLVEFRDRKGAIYTAALADAIPQLGGDLRRQARAALAERLTRMTAATLDDNLGHASAEIRRATALACALKQEKQHVRRLIDLLEDRETEVARAAHRALKSLTGEDFGPPAEATPAERTRAAAAWKAWWHKQPR